MDMQNQAINRTVSLAIGILIFCASSVGTTFAALPPGYAPGTFLYYGGISQNFGTYTTVQAATTATETALDTMEGFHLTYATPVPCSPVYNSDGSLNGLVPYTTIYVNDVPAVLCISGSGVEPWWPHTTERVTSYPGVETIIHCQIEDGVYPHYQLPTVAVAMWPDVPTDYQGQVVVNARVTDNTLYETIACKVNDQLIASITPSPPQPLIPANAFVIGGKVLTREALLVTVTHRAGGNPASGIQLLLHSSRGLDDNFTQPAYPTDQDGQTAGSVETRANGDGAMSTISVGNSNIQTIDPADIVWLPARYAVSFEITCYVVPPESDFLNSPLVSAPGITGRKFHHKFLFETAINGTGQALDGTYIHYHSRTGKFSVLPNRCAPTKSGACAVAGVTSAVDPTVVPMHGEVSIDEVGNRAALDTGNGIIGHHIDVFWGTGAMYDQCKMHWGNQFGLGVTFLHYGAEN